ncbi:unnamed protein product [Sphagnum jensenii]|uniref:Uncharacterized protein n=1 Tax=Sphagnum jensenii TaxID=128206 RepID=A0ABP1AEN3_9BRYO
MDNNDGRKRVKTAAHIGDDYYALATTAAKTNSFPSADLSFSSPHYASRCEAALVVRRAAACGSASGEIASGQSVVGQQVQEERILTPMKDPTPISKDNCLVWDLIPGRDNFPPTPNEYA